jgi:DoxX-like family
MKKNNSIYWTSTGIVSFMMLFSAYNYVANPQMAAAFKHLGFPDYLRYELAIAKVLGALALVIPQIPVRVKEWAYAGFGITFISAFIGHISSGDPVSVAIMPIAFFAVLVISNVYLYKKSKPAIVSFKPSVA